ncbi:ABC transporter substrate-binding protein [Pelomonas sp. KK5]|uniref:substrate-binding periplasmic protein n=1 Tax=Pelomonas sp. KK5 TaxID=1855730 RepID=UPI00097C5443|nr:transporter substrate-binding domain-containing protein [Pelomonas sp. KK5]
MRWRNCLLLLTALAFTGAAAAGGCVKTMRWNDDPPFSMRAPDGSIVGVHVDQVREALRRMDCAVELVEMPWARALTELEAGRLDIVTGALRTADRERYAWFAVPGPQSRNLLWVRLEAWKARRFTRLQQLHGSGFRLGAQIGVRYGEDYDELMSDPAFAAGVRQVSTRRNLWQMLAAGRIDGLIADEMTARTELAQLGLKDRIVNSGIVVRHSPAATAFSRKSTSQEFVDRFNRANDSMIRDGSLDEILRRYDAQ